MISDILNGVSNALYNAFPDVKYIYLETVDQGFKKPCFFLTLIDEEEKPLLGNRAQRDVSLDVMYFPKCKEKQEMLDVASKLYSVLRCISLLNDDKLNGFKLKYEIIDGVLHFFVTYKPIIYYSKEELTKMQQLSRTVGVFNGKA